MQVDFYQLGALAPETVVPLLAERTLAAGERLAVVSADPAQLERVSTALWARAGFLAHGPGEGSDAPRQPIVLGADPAAANGARYLALADGGWREEARGFERVFFLFGEEETEAARGVWRGLDGQEGLIRNHWRHDGRKWQKTA